jgi:ribosomal protein S17E
MLNNIELKDQKQAIAGLIDKYTPAFIKRFNNKKIHIKQVQEAET